MTERRLVDGGASNADEEAVARLLGDVTFRKVPDGAEGRVWRRLSSSAKKSRPLVWAAAGLATGVAAMVVVMSTGEVPNLHVQHPSDATIAVGETFTAMSAGALPDRARVRSNTSRVTLTGPALAQFQLEPETTLSYDVDGDGASIELAAGSFTASTRGAPIEIAAYTARVALGAGTVRVERDEETVVVVALEGTARVTNAGGTVEVREGSRWTNVVAETAALEAEAAPPAVQPAAPAPKPRKQRTVSKRRRRKRPAPAPTEPRRVAEPVAEVTPPIPAARPRTEPAPVPAPGPTDWGVVYRRARAERNAARAIAMFDEVAANDAKLATVARYQAARRTRRSRRFAEAITRFSKLIGTDFDQEARLEIIECRLRTGDLSGAKRDLDAYIGAHAKSARSADVRFLRADLARRSGRCADALDDYAAAAKSRHADDAKYLRAWCLFELGRDAEGRNAMKKYVEDHPKGAHVVDARKKL